MESRVAGPDDVDQSPEESNGFARQIWGKTEELSLVTGGFTSEDALEGADGKGRGEEKGGMRRRLGDYSSLM
jgi:hypothetical protein